LLFSINLEGNGALEGPGKDGKINNALSFEVRVPLFIFTEKKKKKKKKKKKRSNTSNMR
jgi:hypothetical protein